MPVNSVAEMGWTNRSVANTILLVNQQQKQELGTRVQRLMDERGFTNERLAYKAGVSSKTVSRVINAKHELRLGTIEKLAEALDVSEQELRGPPPAPLGLGVEVQEDGVAKELADIKQELADIKASQRALVGELQEIRKALRSLARARRSQAS